jgi:hypothetical protein
VEDAVELIGKIFQEHHNRLHQRSPAVEDVRTKHCLDALLDIHIYLVFLGVIIRSAATRNAFEIYGPIRSMARKLLDTPIRLIISSGWDYMPLTFRPIHRFENYVIVVLPACESANPLLIPLAGHELGHSVWQREELRDGIEDVAVLALVEHVRQKNVVEYAQDLRHISIRKARTRLERDLVFGAACDWLLRQLEEMFCDFVGLYLFGESFVHAFSYFLSPDFPARQSPRYPTVKTRMEQLYRAAESFESTWKTGNYVLPPNIRDTLREIPSYVRTGGFVQLPMTPDPWRTAVSSVAVELVPKLLDRIIELGRQESWKELRSFSPEKRQKIVNDSFQWAVPAAKANHLANILNAAWDIECEPRLWRNLPPLVSIGKGKSESRRREILRELILKNIEVLEYEDKCWEK